MKRTCSARGVGIVFTNVRNAKLKFLDIVEIVDELARKICKDLEIPFVR